MTRSLLLLPALALWGLAACDTMPMPVEPGGGIGDGGGSGADTCGLERLREFVGQPAEAVTAAMFAVPVRVIRPGDVVTMDFNPERINFRVGLDGRIQSVDCG